MCHHWPWCSPWSVWRLPLDEWVLFAMQADAEIEAIRKASDPKGR